MKSIDNTKTLVNNITDYVLERAGKNTLPISNKTRDNENYYLNGDTKYFLTEEQWNEVYHLILNYEGEERYPPNIVKDQDKLHLKLLESQLSEKIKDLTKHHAKMGRPSTMDEPLEALIQILDSDVKSYTTIIYLYLRDLILRALYKGNFATESGLQLIENTVSIGLGEAVLSSYFYSTVSLKAESKEFQKLWIKLFSFYNQSIQANLEYQKQRRSKEIISLSLDQRNEISKEFKITSPFILEFSSKKIMLIGLNMLISNQSTMKWNAMEDHLQKEGLYDDTNLYRLKKLFEESLDNSNVLLGSIITNVLIKENIFTSAIKYEKHEKQKDKVKSINTLKLNQYLVLDITSSGSNFKPFLSYSNYQYVTKNEVYPNRENNQENNPLHVNINLKHIVRPIHANPNGNGYTQKTSPIHNREIVSMKLSVDSQFYYSYLAFIGSIVNRDYITIEDKEPLFAFLSIYEINFKNLLQEAKDEQSTNYIISLINYASKLDLEEQVDLTFLKDQNIPNDFKKTLKLYYDKIFSYKYVLINSLSDFAIYTRFNYVIVPSFFDFRGRRYYVGTSFNIQSYAFLKAFIKHFEPSQVSKYSDKIKTILLEQLSSQPDLQRKAENLMNNKYKTHIDEYVNKYLYSFVEGNIDYVDFLNILKHPLIETIINDQNNSYAFYEFYKILENIIKNKSKILILMSYICLERRWQLMRDINYVNNYSYDMVTSGYQMTALLFRSRPLALKSNLIGDQKLDLYKDITNHFNIYLDNCLATIRKFIDYLKDNETTQFYVFKAHLIPTNHEIKKVSGTILNSYLVECQKEKLLEDYFNSNLEDILQYSSILTQEDIKITKPNKLNKFSYCLLIMTRLSVLNDFINNNSWIYEYNILQNRNLFKRIIMIQIYGGTRRGREDAFYDYIRDTCTEIGIFKEPSEYKPLFPYIEAFYNKYRKEHLSETDQLVKLGQKLAKRGQLISVKTPHFKYYQAPVDFKAQRQLKINTYRMGIKRKPYQITLLRAKLINFKNLKNGTIIINQKKQATLFPPNFIHSMDATMVHMTIQFIEDINLLLKEKKSHFQIATVHDNYCAGRFLFPVLNIILMFIYRKIYTFNYLHTLEESFPEKTDEFNDFIKEFMKDIDHKDGFSEKEIKNENMIKFG